ncbi:hypothetical protein BDZ94DRAFT_604588 [Collybia nuda]|uniref:Uncharacterized protein n=1 Tax=Collybia nuda TaxID=64659 RepID=A0A9P5Y6I0_9AGAR|nr:hypothetical protein BDZ94DRAFT_604588 [Collybia nuda]
MARQAMSAQQDAFINKCVTVSALLPSNIFHKAPQKRESANKVESTNVQSGASSLSPLSLDTPPPLPSLGEDEDEQLMPMPSPSPPVTGALSSMPPSVEDGGPSISNIVVEIEEQVLVTQKRARASEDSSSVLSTPAKRSKFTSTPSPSTISSLPRRSPRNLTKARCMSISQSSPTTTIGPPPYATRTGSFRNTLVTDSPHQTVNRRSTIPLTPGLPTQSTSRDVSLPPICCFGQLKAARRTSVPFPRLPLSALPTSSVVRLNPRDKPLPVSCPAPIRAMIEKIPKSAGWMPRALSSILAVNIGPNYYHLVICLINLESLYGFVSGQRGPRSNSRPDVLVKWINSGRTLSEKSCVVRDVGAYAKKWWRWWQTLQPKWRVFDKMGVPISVAEPTTFEAWNCLLVPGANGFLGVVASLYWWGCSLLTLKEKQRKEEEGSWMRAVEDCTWVVESLVKLMKIRNKSNMDDTIDFLHSDSDEVDDKDSEDEENELQELEVVC